MERSNSTKKAIILLFVLITALAIMLATTFVASPKADALAESGDSLYDKLGFGIYPKINADNQVVDPESALDSQTGLPDYSSGVCAPSDKLPVIIIRLEGESEKEYNNITYYYRAQEKLNTVSDGEEWKLIDDSVKSDEYAVLYADNIVPIGEYYRKYIFFKTVINEAGVGQVGSKTEEYVGTQFVDLIVDRTMASTTAYAINSITTTYYENGSEPYYDTDDPKWVSSSIKFILTSNNNTTDSTFFAYSYQTKLDPISQTMKRVWIPAQRRQNEITGTWEAVAVISETYEGEVMFMTSDLSGENEQEYGASRKYIKLDTETPNFEISATKNGGTERYSYGSGTSTSSNNWSSTDVTYTLVPYEQSTCISGAEYYYNVNNTRQNGKEVWERIIPQYSGNTYVYAITFSSSVSHLKFRGQSNAGKIYDDVTDYITNIDKEVPVLNLAAEDARGNVVLTGGYASDTVVFSMANDNPDNISTVSFQYKIGTDGQWQNVNKVNGNYIYSASQPIVRRQYFFRAISKAGLYDEEEFIVSALDSKFSISMEEPVISVNADGWAKDKIAVYLSLPTVLGIDELNAYAEEYDFYSAVYGDNTTEKEIVATLADTYTQSGVKYNKYRVYIDTSLNGNIMSFYALNKARDKSATLYTKEIHLDLKNPTSTVVSKLYNSTVVLGEDDWANGRVVIEITPDSNISGLKCYPLLGEEGSYVTGREIEMKDGKFSYSVTATGVYRFRLLSGAGRYQTPEIVVPVNIDNGDITFERMILTVDGQEIVPETDTVSSSVRIDFVSNQAGHFNYYYQSYIGGSPLPDAYQLGEGSYFTFVPQANAEGTIKLAFYLESKAVNAEGNRYTTIERKVNIRYNVKDFTISVKWDDLSDWRDTSVEFQFFANDDTTSIKCYQMKLEGRDWQTIINDVQSGVTATYSFEGVEQYTSDGKLLGKAYNGNVLFRAINTAGHESVTVGSEIFVKIDRTTPDPENAINQAKGGEIVYSESDGWYFVYSYEDIKYMETNGNSREPVFNNLAPIDYYYKPYNGEVSVSSTTGGMQKLSNITTLEGRYWLGAKNKFNESTFKIYYFVKETEAPSATLSGGTLNPNSGLYEFNWQDTITISISVKSQTAVYYWYKIGSGEWIKYNDVADADSLNGALKNIIFMGQPDANYPEAIIGNMDETIHFKISNLSGSEYLIEDRIRAKIDTESPTFEVETSVLGEIIAPTDRNKWYPDDVYVRIIPTSFNPGGVVYKYRTEGAGYNYERLPGDGTFFSTDDLITYSGNGMVKIYLLATARATGYEETYEMTLYIDKILPDFDLVGEITINGTANTRNIESGEWAQADEVRITRQAKTNPASNVEYKYSSSLNPTAAAEAWPDSSPTRVVSKISVITVTATNEAGLSVTKEFAVNIDNDAPVINSGIIKNKMRQLADGTYVIDTAEPFRYYIDQVITYIEPNLKYAKYNNFPLANGQIIATNTVDNSNGGYVHIVIEDMAGNKSELVFYMTIFDLTVNTMTLAEEDIALLESFENDYNNLKNTLTTSRQEYFAATISRLWDRVSMLEKQVDDYQQYLVTINNRVAFDLKSDYNEMYTYLNYFTTADVSILYPQWQQDMITTPANTYGAYYQKLVSEFAKLQALMENVKSVENDTAVLPATNVVEKSDYASVLRVYNAYNSLTVDQRSVFKSTLYTKLIELKRSCEVLMLQDESTGIDISGKDLAANVTIDVENYDKSTELVNNAQLTLLENYPEGDARAIVTVSRISLSGYGAQYDTGDIVITLPIPEDFQSYIKFAVYKLSADGTVSKMDGVTINGDGKSVYFATDSLGTYVLATNANTTVRQASEKIYGTVEGVEIDGTLLSYITYASVAVAVMLIIILIIVAIKKKWFLRTYNRANKNHMSKRGMDYVPKGNAPARTNPASPMDKFEYKQKIYQNKNKY